MERLVCSSNQAEQMCLKPHMVLTITETAVFSLCHSSHTCAIRFLFSAHQVGGKIMPGGGVKPPPLRADATPSFRAGDGTSLESRCHGDESPLARDDPAPSIRKPCRKKQTKRNFPFLPLPLRSFARRALKRAKLTKEELVSPAE